MLGWETSFYDAYLGLGISSEGTFPAASALVEDSALACFSVLKECGRPVH